MNLASCFRSSMIRALSLPSALFLLIGTAGAQVGLIDLSVTVRLEPAGGNSYDVLYDISMELQVPPEDALVLEAHLFLDGVLWAVDTMVIEDDPFDPGLSSCGASSSSCGGAGSCFLTNPAPNYPVEDGDCAPASTGSGCSCYYLVTGGSFSNIKLQPGDLVTVVVNPNNLIIELGGNIANNTTSALVPWPPASYCTSGTSASGCSAGISVQGTASATASAGFLLEASGVEGDESGLFFFGTNGRQASPWGNGTSYQCVMPPVTRAGLLSGTGTNGLCDGSFSQDLNALWCPTCPKPAKNPGAGAVVQAQLWYRDPKSTSNQTTSLSNAIEFCVAL